MQLCFFWLQLQSIMFDSPTEVKSIDLLFGVLSLLTQYMGHIAMNTWGDGGNQCILVGQDSALKTTRRRQANANSPNLGQTNNWTQDCRDRR